NVLYITTLLHDIAKGRPEDHSIAGAKVARRLCPRLGFNAADTELVAWLIEQHLTMSVVAQSRDLSDRKTIENFAAVVQSVEQINANLARHYPAYWLKVGQAHKIRHARFMRSSEQGGHKLNINVGFDELRAVTELTILAQDHPWLLSIIAGACASAGGNIVDA